MGSLMVIYGSCFFDNHEPGMAVQLYVQAHLGHYHILTQKYSQKPLAQLKFMPLFTYTRYKNIENVML